MVTLAKTPSEGACKRLGVFCLGVYFAVCTPLLAAEVDEAQVAADNADALSSATLGSTEALFKQFESLSRTLTETDTVTTAEIAAASGASSGASGASASSQAVSPRAAEAAKAAEQAKADKEKAEAKSTSLGEKDGSGGSASKSNDLPVKNIAGKNGRVGEYDGGDSSGSRSSDGPTASVNSPTTSTLNLGDLGNLNSVIGTMNQIGGQRRQNAINRSMGTMAGAVAQAQQRNQPPPGSQDEKKKPNTDPSPNDPNAGMAKFGQANDLTMGNIAQNRADKDSDKDKADKDKDKDKDKNNKDKNKDKDKKKEEEKQKLQKELDDIVQRDPFKFEDYEKLRDLFAKQGDQAGDAIKDNPKLSAIKDKIVNEFAPRDASPSSAKDPLLTFLKKEKEDAFQNPILADPNAIRHQGEQNH